MTETTRRKALATALAAALAPALCMPAMGTQRVDVGNDAKGEGITVRASADVQADPRTVLS
ncbi:MAG: hypothetical protein JSS56_29905, partial [Proteobacteria bacterium]|nr:hypothetical protein [Pseudomonadota bacterium]